MAEIGLEIIFFNSILKLWKKFRKKKGNDIVQMWFNGSITTLNTIQLLHIVVTNSRIVRDNYFYGAFIKFFFL